MFIENVHKLMGAIGIIGLLILVYGSLNGNEIHIKDWLIGLCCIGFFITIELLNRSYIVSCPFCRNKINYTKLWEYNLKCRYCNRKIGHIDFKTLKNIQS